MPKQVGVSILALRVEAKLTRHLQTIRHAPSYRSTIGREIALAFHCAMRGEGRARLKIL